MENTIHLTTLLAGRRSEILDRWTRHIQREHADKELSRGELRDHLPSFFNEVLSALRNQEEAAAPTATASGENPSASAHGTQRLRDGFDLVEVIREYEILTECILSEVESAGANISISAFRRLQRLLNAGRADAVAAYIRRRDADFAEAHSRHIAFIAHELRNPLMTAFMAVNVLQKTAPDGAERELKLLVRNLGALRDLIDEALITDRLSGPLPLNREALDLRVLLEEAVNDTRLTATHRQIELVLEAPATLPFRGDGRVLRSAVSNLLGNAIKFTHEGESVTVRAFERPAWIAIEIEDRCGGLPQGNPEELFKPFVQRGSDRTGFGLGLAIVEQSIEAHGGRVTARSLPGKGCVFSLELPQDRDASVPGTADHDPTS